jgi:regulator of nonsense transcripts 1
MANQAFDVHQDIFKQPHPPISIITINENALGAKPQILADFLSTADGGVIGLAPVYGSKCVLTRLAFSTLSNTLLVTFSSAKPRRNKQQTGRTLLQDNILCHPERRKYAFSMDRLSLSLFLDQGVRITGGVHLLSSSTSARQSKGALMDALGGVISLYKVKVDTLFKHQETSVTPARDTALQAWAACRAASLSSMCKNLSSKPRIDTKVLGSEVRT